MAILTRPLFHSQERIDLEDLVQLQSGLRTDARLWTRQVLADKNFILKGFDVSGIGTNQISVNLLDATLLFAGRRDLTGVATIIVDGGSVAGDTLTIANSDGSSFTITAASSGSNTATNYLIDSDPVVQATNIAASITLIGSGLAAAAVSNNITVTASRTGYQNIVASNPSNFNNNGSIIGTFDYAASTIESPSDLSYFILQSGATGVDTSITREVSASERALTGVASKTLYVYGKLVTGQGTPITKAFWDPSANSGSGAEFNQRVDTASDLEMQLNVTESELDQVTDAAATEFFANVAICEIEVDSSGIILSIRDTRPLFFEAQDDRPWDRANSYASMRLESTITNVTVDVMIPAGVIPGTTVTTRVQASTGGPFTLDETVSFWPITGVPSEPLTSAQVQSLSGVTTDFNKLDLAAVPARQRIAIGETSGTIRIIDEVRSNFFRDDKALGDFRNGLSALATEINNMKGTENWYDDPPASAKDLLRFINSTIVGLDPNARYSWEATGTADGTLSLQLDPLSTAELTVLASNTFVSGTSNIMFRFKDTTGTDTVVHTLTARTSDPGVRAFGGLNIGFTGMPADTTLGASVTVTVAFTQVRTNGTTFSTSVALTSGLSATGVADAMVTALNGDPIFAGSYTASRTGIELVVTANETGTFFNADWGTLPSGSNLAVTVNTNIAFGVNGIGAENFLIGTDSEATASHITSSINFISGLSASFQESATTSGDYRITIGRSDLTVNNFISNAAGISPTNTEVMFPPSANTTMLANLRLYGVDNAFTFPASTYTVGANEVLFVTLPDLDALPVSDVNFSGAPFRYSQSGPTVSATAWNATNRDIFQASNNIVKTVPIGDFESNERNYWIAYRDNAETIYIRDVGELGTGESANIGHGISNATLSYIGAPSENTSTPDYPLVNTINSFPPTGTEGAYLTTDGANDFNKTLVAQSENLTSAINDLNDHLTSVKDTQYQNLGLKLINGGYWGWSIASGVGTLTTQEDAQIQIPGLADNRNNLRSDTTVPFSHTLGQSGDVLYVDINRQDNRSDKTVDTNLTVVAANVNAARTGFILFEPTRDRIVFARRVDEFVFIGVNGTIRLADDQAAPLDSALQFIGVNGSGQLPRQLNTAPVTAQVLSVGTSTVTFPTGGNVTTGTTDDTSVTLDLSIGGGVLFWEGARLDFATGIVQDSNGLTPFRSRSGGNTTFNFDNLPALTGTTNQNREIYYGVSLDDAGAITSSTGTDLLPATGPNGVAENLNKRLGEPNITKSSDIGFTNTTGTNERAIPPEFGGALPIALVRVTTDSSGAYELITMDRVTVLGASGSGGGGGTGNAVQDINNYLNRLNGSTFGYFSALVPAVSTEDFVDSNSTAGIANAGISLTAGLSVLTTNLIDQEFIDDALIPERMEIEAIWGQTTEAPITTQIDPNARWFISLNSNDVTSGGTLGTNQFTPLTFESTKNVVGVITSADLLVGTNLTNAPLTQRNTFFVENHGFSTGHKISLTTAGGLILTDDTDIYVHSLNADSFQLYTTVANADAGGSTGLIEITASTLGSPVFTRGEGIIPRIGHTNTVRAVFDQRDLVTTVGAFNRRRGGAYSTTSNPTVRLFVTGDADSGTGAPEIIMTSLALFYADQLGIEGVNPNGLDDLNDIIRGSHLVNPVNANASYGAAGRGVTLLNNAATPVNTEIALDANNNITVDGTAPITTNGATTGQILVANASGIFSPTDVSSGGGGLLQINSFLTAGSFTYTAPTSEDPIFIEVEASGGGGGGNGGPIAVNNTLDPIGGSSGEYGKRYIQVVSGTAYTIVVGIAGPGGAAFTTDVGFSVSGMNLGTVGGNTIFDTGGSLEVTWIGGPTNTTTRQSNQADFYIGPGGSDLANNGYPFFTGTFSTNGSSTVRAPGGGGTNTKAQGGAGGSGSRGVNSARIGSAAGGGAGWFNGAVGGSTAGSGIGRTSATGGAGGVGGMIIKTFSGTIS